LVGREQPPSGVPAGGHPPALHFFSPVFGLKKKHTHSFAPVAPPGTGPSLPCAQSDAWTISLLGILGPDCLFSDRRGPVDVEKVGLRQAEDRTGGRTHTPTRHQGLSHTHTPYCSRPPTCGEVESNHHPGCPIVGTLSLSTSILQCSVTHTDSTGGHADAGPPLPRTQPPARVVSLLGIAGPLLFCQSD
jgi:hypothetical protein